MSFLSQKETMPVQIFKQPRSAYIHVPFCVHRCGYCDFTLVANRDDLMDDYLRALEIELRGIEPATELDTLFLGGGTPTQLPSEQLSRLMEILFKRFQLVEKYEFSVEANPAGMSSDKIEVLASAGVNRVSLGVQSFDASVLRLLERDHRCDDVTQTVGRLKERFTNISLDLIFAVPGQSLNLWKETLRAAIELSPQHVSTYGLTVEKGTAFWSRRQKGELVAPPDELQRQMYGMAMDELTSQGFKQYEISNFALSGFQSLHNEAYWKGDSYFAFGPGAARYIDGRRETNHRSVTTWLKRILSGESAVAETETLSPEERARETLIIGLRRTVGIHKADFQHRTGFDMKSLAGETICKYLEAGLLEETDSHLRLTREGRFLADTVVVDLL